MRVLAIGLDGFESSLADELVSKGEMPNFAGLRERSARFALEHGPDRLSGLAWEHVSSGIAPSDGARWSAVTFNPATYQALQEHTASRPFVTDLPLRTVVFDAPYWDLEAEEQTRGVTAWGAHDPGVDPASRPTGLHDEIARRFGTYPAEEWIYGCSWPSVARTRESAAALSHAVEVRTRVARWLLSERLPDWDLGLVVVSECHSAIEPLWHGVDKSHPLHELPTAGPAAQGLADVYRAVDMLIGELASAFPDVALSVFSMHGMGPNEADVAGMALLPELLYRHAFGAPYMRERSWSSYLSNGTPLLAEDEKWESELAALVPIEQSPTPSWWQRVFGRPNAAGRFDVDRSTPPGALTWMPAKRYQPFWPRMPAFALPAFYDGRVRVNLEGREAHGIVPRSEYDEVLRRIGVILEECTEPIGATSPVESIERFHGAPEELPDSCADLTVVWRNTPIGLDHPRLGRIGPLPWRRTGGHTGGHGFLYLSGAGLEATDFGIASSFDVVPTIVELSDNVVPPRISGKSLLPQIR